MALGTRVAGCIVAAATLCLTAATTAQAQDDAGFIVIVNSANPLDSLERDALRRLFLKQSRTWPDGEEAHPVDQSAASGVREAFSRAVLRQPMAAVNAYWQRQILAGRASPPQVKQSDAEILDFVAADAQAVGYVVPMALLPSSVKVLELTDPDDGDGAGSGGGLSSLR